MFNPIKKVEDIVNGIKWFIQRGRKGYSDRDLWSLDTHIYGILSKSLLDLANNRIGYPCLNSNSSNSSLDNCNCCQCSDDWDRELRENAELFRLLHEDNWHMIGLSSYKAILEEEAETREKAMSWLQKRMVHLWD